MRTIEYIDEIIIKLGEKVARGVEKVFGINCFGIGRFFLLTFLILDIWQVVKSVEKMGAMKLDSDWFLNLFKITISVLVTIPMVPTLYGISKKIERDQFRGVANALRYNPLIRMNRLMIVYISLMGGFVRFNMLQHLWMISLSLALIFLACSFWGGKSLLEKLSEKGLGRLMEPASKPA